MKKYLFPCIGLLVGLSLISYGFIANKKTAVKTPVYVEYFKDGQILYPDYACPDTLIVRNARGLNEAFAPIEQGLSGFDFGDSDYDSLFHVYCEYYIGSFEDQCNKLKLLEPTWDSLKIATAINED